MLFQWHYSCSRPLNEADCNTLRGYTHCVHCIRQYSNSLDERIINILTTFTNPLILKLQSLYWQYCDTLPVVHTTVPSLTSVHLDFYTVLGVPTPTEFLDTFGECCPNIRQFGAFFTRPESLDAVISYQLSLWTNVEHAEFPLVTLSLDTIVHLPSVSTLKLLWFTLSADLGNHITHLGSVLVFPNLAELYICSTSLKSITNLFWVWIIPMRDSHCGRC